MKKTRVLTPEQRERKKETKRLWDLKNKEKELEKKKEYTLANKERIAAYKKEYRERNKEELLLETKLRRRAKSLGHEPKALAELKDERKKRREEQGLFLAEQKRFMLDIESLI